MMLALVSWQMRRRGCGGERKAKNAMKMVQCLGHRFGELSLSSHIIKAITFHTLIAGQVTNISKLGDE